MAPEVAPRAAEPALALNSSLLTDAALGSEGGQAAVGETTKIGWSLASDPALFITAVNALVACGDLGELAAGAAHLTQKLLGTTDVLVLMRGPDGEFSGGRAGASKDLESWATDLLQAGAAHRVSSGGQHLGAPIEAASVGVSKSRMERCSAREVGTSQSGIGRGAGRSSAPYYTLVRRCYLMDRSCPLSTL